MKSAGLGPPRCVSDPLLLLMGGEVGDMEGHARWG